MQRLFAYAVTRQNHRPVLRIPQSKREHTPELAHKRIGKGLIKMNDGCRIAAGKKLMRSFQLPAEIHVVIYLSVEADPHSAVFVRKRLLARAQINDAQAAVAKGDPAPQIHS